MFGRKKMVKVPVPGSPVVVVSEVGDKRETEETLRHNAEMEEANIDKTVADSFPASDPPSSVPETRERVSEKKVA